MNRIFKWFRSLKPQSVGLAIGFFGIWLLALSLRFWGLSRFNTLVFDEVYYAKYAVDYLNGTELFDAHPPLGKYCIAVAIWLSQFFDPLSSETTDVAGQNLNPFRYRWLNALMGSFIPVLLSGIAYQLGRRWSYALIAGFLAALEGIWLVESRYALINIYLIFFGLLGQWLFFVAIDQKSQWKDVFLMLSGISLGATIAVKWNGLGFLGGIYLLWGFAGIGRLMMRKLDDRLPWVSPWMKLTQLSALKLLIYLGVVPIAIYIVSWIPHLRINLSTTFWEVHEQILSYHQGLGTGKDVHPYCSPWYSWPLLWRPISYFYEKSNGENAKILPDPEPLLKPSVYDVHLLGNPFLFWISSAAIFIIFLMVTSWILRGVVLAVTSDSFRSSKIRFFRQSSEFFVLSYLVINYMLNWLPWAKVSRCTFLYLYMGSLCFAVLAIAWFVDRWLRSDRWGYQIMGGLTLFAIVLSFLFWLPIYLGLPLSEEGFQLRMWWQSWI